MINGSLGMGMEMGEMGKNLFIQLIVAFHPIPLKSDWQNFWAIAANLNSIWLANSFPPYFVK